jgi:hypothetical protein
VARAAKCFDKRDKIFSVLGIVDRHCTNGLTADIPRPDYMIPPEILFTRITRCLLKHTSTLDILSITAPNSQLVSLPTWVVNWDVRNTTVALIGLNVLFRAGISASFNGPRFTTTDLTMTCYGAKFQTVSELHKYQLDAVTPNKSPSSITFIQSLFQFYLTLSERINNRRRIKVFWRTLIANNSFESMNQPALPSAGKSFLAWVKYTLSECLWTSINIGSMYERETWGYCSIIDQLDFKIGSEEGLSVQDIKESFKLFDAAVSSEGEFDISIQGELKAGLARTYGQLFGYVALGRRLFKTEQGYLGLGPKDTQEGDQVWLICDARVLFVLRPASAPNTFTLVGEAYIHDFMDGELLEKGCGLRDKIGPVYLI